MEERRTARWTEKKPFFIKSVRGFLGDFLASDHREKEIVETAPSRVAGVTLLPDSVRRVVLGLSSRGGPRRGMWRGGRIIICDPEGEVEVRVDEGMDRMAVVSYVYRGIERGLSNLGGALDETS